MSRKITDKGPYSTLLTTPASTKINKYFFVTDGLEGSAPNGPGVYYYSDGSLWTAKSPDFTDLDPETDASLSCGLSASNAIQPFKVTATGYLQTAPATGTLTDLSGSTTTSNVSHLVAAANPDRKYFNFQNLSNTDMYLGFGAAAVANKGVYVVKVGGSFAFNSGFVSTQAINVICAGTNLLFTAVEGT